MTCKDCMYRKLFWETIKQTDKEAETLIKDRLIHDKYMAKQQRITQSVSKKWRKDETRENI
jgi:hypothetical protein